jgi:hypothetical protein
VVRRALIEHQGVVAGGGYATYTARCPSSAPHPVSGEVFAVDGAGSGKLVFAASRPRGRTGWQVVIQNLSMTPLAYGAGIVCLGTTARFAYPQTTAAVDPQQPGGGAISCPRAAPTAIGGYFAPQSPSDLGAVSLAGLVPFSHRALILLKGIAARPVAVVIGAVCSTLHRVRAGGQGVASPGGQFEFRGSCPRSTRAIGADFAQTSSDNPGSLELVASFAHGKNKWATGVMSTASTPTEFVAGAVCVR